MIQTWAPRARKNVGAANLVLAYSLRKDRLLGLGVSVNRTELTGAGGVPLGRSPPNDEPPINWANLTNDELKLFEHLNLKLRGKLPPPESEFIPSLQLATAEDKAHEIAGIAPDHPPR
jgi:hypothetical protein